MNYYSEETKTALEAIGHAQRIAFAPMVFQASRILRDSGILQKIKTAGPPGISLEDLVQGTSLSNYGVRVLVEAGLGIGLILLNEGKYSLTNTGLFILDDKLTRINMDFTNDVCYKGLTKLEESIKTGKPAGLSFLGDWQTIYEGLSVLPEPAKKSWFDFDHYYSDSAFAQALQKVLCEKPLRLLDIGGNTGKWAMNCVEKDPMVHVTIVDLPGQTEMAKKNIETKGLSDRIGFVQANLLDAKVVLPSGFDGVWMSQFLDCFSDEQIISILQNCKSAIKDEGHIFILETFWDRQRFEASAFCLQMTSLYFTAMANGNSQMYDSNVFFKLIGKAGLEVVEITDNIGVSHSLIKCKKIKNAD